MLSINQQKKIKINCKINHLESHNAKQEDPHFFDEFLEKWDKRRISRLRKYNMILTLTLNPSVISLIHWMNYILIQLIEFKTLVRQLVERDSM